MTTYLPPLMPPWHVLAVLAGGVGLLVLSEIVHRLSGDYRDKIAGVGGVVIVFSLIELMFSSGVTLIEFYLPAFFRSGWVALAAIPMGIILYYLRANARATYALIEIVGAVLVTVYTAVTQTGSAGQRASALLGAVYFLVRGLDNGAQGDLRSKLVLWIKSRDRIFFAGAAVALLGMVSVVAVGLSTPPLAPPYMTSARGPAIPVSPMKCGHVWVECDEAAWRARDRLVKGTDEQRRQAEIAADTRARAILKTHGW